MKKKHIVRTNPDSNPFTTLTWIFIYFEPRLYKGIQGKAPTKFPVQARVRYKDGRIGEEVLIESPVVWSVFYSHAYSFKKKAVGVEWASMFVVEETKPSKFRNPLEEDISGYVGTSFNLEDYRESAHPEDGYNEEEVKKAIERLLFRYLDRYVDQCGLGSDDMEFDEYTPWKDWLNREGVDASNEEF